jgi:hypothetical protein
MADRVVRHEVLNQSSIAVEAELTIEPISGRADVA